MLPFVPKKQLLRVERTCVIPMETKCRAKKKKKKKNFKTSLEIGDHLEGEAVWRDGRAFTRPREQGTDVAAPSAVAPRGFGCSLRGLPPRRAALLLHHG